MFKTLGCDKVGKKTMNTVIKGVIATANFSIQSLYYELVWLKKIAKKLNLN